MTQLLVDMDIIKRETLPEGRSGRRTNLYSIVDSYHSMFIEQKNNCFSCISIDIKGNVTERFDFVMSSRFSLKENVKMLFKKFKKKRVFGKYCIGIFAVCDKEVAEFMPSEVMITTKEQIILDCLSERDKMILFNLGNKYVISAYSHIHYPEKGIAYKTINKAIKIDKEYNFSTALYDGVFLSLSKYSYDNLINLITIV